MQRSRPSRHEPIAGIKRAQPLMCSLSRGSDAAHTITDYGNIQVLPDPAEDLLIISTKEFFKFKGFSVVGNAASALANLPIKNAQPWWGS